MNSYMLLFIFGIILANYSQILLKKATLQQYDSRIKEYVNPYVIIGYSLFVINAGLNVIAMKGMALKTSISIRILKLYHHINFRLVFPRRKNNET